MRGLGKFQFRPSSSECNSAGGSRAATGAVENSRADYSFGVKATGRHTQFPGASSDSPRRQLVIGLDFGTAYTKVVIGETTKAYAVPFPEYVDKDNPYLLPGVLSLDKRGHAHLGRRPDARTYTDLKMRLLDRDMSDETIVLITIFIARVLQEVRIWFLTSHAGAYGGMRLDWCVNVGLPTSQYHDEKLKHFYRDIVKAAWLASVKPEPVTVSLVEDCFADSTASLKDEDIGLFPEFVAQVNSYVKSPMRQSDLHLLVDVGAGTVDVAVFVVHENDQGDLFPIFSKSVSKRGVQYLPNEPQGQKIFSELLRRQIKTDIDFVRNGKYPEYWDPARANVLPFFLCGGGAYVDFYEAIADRMVNKSFPCALRKLELPVPQRLVAQEVRAAEYHRLSVAYGLSFDAFDIGQIVPEHEIEEVAEKVSRCGYTTCPICNGTGGSRGNDCDRCDGNGWLTL